MVCGIGYLGDGPYNTKSSWQGIKIYNRWTNILNRVVLSKDNHHIYSTCSLHPDWLNFQNFASWFVENYVVNWQIDKDILKQGNKIYGPDTCCFVPKEINVLIQQANNFAIRKGKYLVRISLTESHNKSQLYIGDFDTLIEAKLAYGAAKKLRIKSVVEANKYNLQTKIKTALLNYNFNEQ